MSPRPSFGRVGHPRKRKTYAAPWERLAGAYRNPAPALRPEISKGAPVAKPSEKWHSEQGCFTILRPLFRVLA